jgi:hypothetical protein
VSAAVLEATFSSRPKTRYPAASAKIMSAYLATKVVATMPDRVLDFIILQNDAEKENELS